MKSYFCYCSVRLGVIIVAILSIVSTYLLYRDIFLHILYIFLVDHKCYLEHRFLYTWRECIRWTYRLIGERFAV